MNVRSIVFLLLIVFFSVSVFAAIPVQNTPVLTATDIYVSDTANLTVTINATDGDSDPLFNTTVWFINGVSILPMIYNFDIDGTTNRNYGNLSNGLMTKNGVVNWNTNGRVGGSYNFDSGSTNNYLSTTYTSAMGYNDFTACAWFNISSLPTVQTLIRMADFSMVGGWDIRLIGGPSIQSEYRTQRSADEWTNIVNLGGGTFSYNNWHHVCLAIDGASTVSGTGTAKLYLDGVLSGTNTHTGMMDYDGAAITYTIGSNGNSNTSKVKGDVDEVLIFNRTLSASQINKIYTQGSLGQSWDTLTGDETQQMDSINVCSYVNDKLNDSNYMCSNTLKVSLAQCGNVGASTTLSNNVNSNGTCLNITASDIEIDCNGFNITYGLNGSNNLYGIYASPSYTNISVKNCGIIDGNSSGQDNYGIYFAQDNGRIVDNVFRYNSTDVGSSGIRLSSTSTGYNISNNIFYTTSTTNGYGMIIDGASNFIVSNNTFNNNNIGVPYSVYIAGGNSVITNNIFNITGNSNNNGIIYNIGNNNNITYNKFYIYNGGAFPIYVRTFSVSNILISNNKVDVYSSGNFINGFYIDGTHNVTIEYNNITYHPTATGIAPNIFYPVQTNDVIFRYNNVIINSTMNTPYIFNFNYQNKRTQVYNNTAINYKASLVRVVNMRSATNATFVNNSYYSYASTMLSFTDTEDSSGILFDNNDMTLIGNDSNQINCQAFDVATSSSSSVTNSTFSNNRITCISNQSFSNGRVIATGNSNRVNGLSGTVFKNNIFKFDLNGSVNIRTILDLNYANGLTLDNNTFDLTGDTSSNFEWFRLYTTSGNAILTNNTFKNEHGSVKFNSFSTSGLSNNPIIYNSDFNISTNRVYLNSSKAGFLNTSATILFTEVPTHVAPSFAPAVLASFSNNGVQNFTKCPDSVCTITNYSAPNLTFDVTHFTTYTVGNGIIDCPQENNQFPSNNTDYFLLNDLTADSLPFGANSCIYLADNTINTSIDCDGKTINTTVGGSMNGIFSFNSKDIEVSNCYLGTPLTVGVGYINNTRLSIHNNFFLFANSSGVLDQRILSPMGSPSINTTIDNNYFGMNGVFSLADSGIGTVIKNNYFTFDIVQSIYSNFMTAIYLGGNINTSIYNNTFEHIDNGNDSASIVSITNGFGMQNTSIYNNFFNDITIGFATSNPTIKNNYTYIYNNTMVDVVNGGPLTGDNLYVHDNTMYGTTTVSVPVFRYAMTLHSGDNMNIYNNNIDNFVGNGIIYGFGIVVLDNVNNLNIMNNNVSGSDISIGRVGNTAPVISNVQVSNNRIDGHAFGVFFSDPITNLLVDNNIINLTVAYSNPIYFAGVFIRNQTDANVRDNIISGDTALGWGVISAANNNLTLDNNTVQGFTTGFQMIEGSTCTISNSRINGSRINGTSISLQEYSNCLIDHVDIDNVEHISIASTDSTLNVTGSSFTNTIGNVISLSNSLADVSYSLFDNVATGISISYASSYNPLYFDGVNNSRVLYVIPGSTIETVVSDETFVTVVDGTQPISLAIFSDSFVTGGQNSTVWISGSFPFNCTQLLTMLPPGLKSCSIVLDSVIPAPGYGNDYDFTNLDPYLNATFKWQDNITQPVTLVAWPVDSTIFVDGTSFLNYGTTNQFVGVGGTLIIPWNFHHVGTFPQASLYADTYDIVTANTMYMDNINAKISWGPGWQIDFSPRTSVLLGDRIIAVNSRLNPNLNSTVNVTFKGVNCDGLLIRYLPGFTSSLANVIMNGSIMADIDTPSGGACNDPTICDNVVCVDGTLNFTAYHFSTFGIGNNTPPSVTLLGPVNGTVLPPQINYANFTWEYFDIEGDNITSYQIQIDSAEDFLTPLQNIVSFSNDTSIMRTIPNVTGKIYWRVRASDADGYGTYSDIYQFTITSQPVIYSDVKADYRDQLTFVMYALGIFFFLLLATVLISIVYGVSIPIPVVIATVLIAGIGTAVIFAVLVAILGGMPL